MSVSGFSDLSAIRNLLCKSRQTGRSKLSRWSSVHRLREGVTVCHLSYDKSEAFVSDREFYVKRADG